MAQQRVATAFDGSASDAINDVRNFTGPPGSIPAAPAAGTGGIGEWASTITADLTTAVKTAFSSIASAANKPASTARTGTEDTGEWGKPIVWPGAKDSVDHDAIHAAIEEMHGLIETAQQAYTGQVQQLNSALALTKLTEDQKTALVIAAVKEREDKEIDAISAVQARWDLTNTELKRLENEKRKIIKRLICRSRA